MDEPAKGEQLVWSGTGEGVCELRDLTPGHAYAVRVRAHSEAGAGKWSAPVEVRTMSCTMDPPSPPAVHTKTSTTMQVVWWPTEGGRGPIEGVADEGVVWELQMDGGVRITANSDGVEEESWDLKKLKGFDSFCGHHAALAAPPPACGGAVCGGAACPAHAHPTAAQPLGKIRPLPPLNPRAAPRAGCPSGGMPAGMGGGGGGIAHRSGQLPHHRGFAPTPFGVQHAHAPLGGRVAGGLMEATVEDTPWEGEDSGI